MQARPWLNRTVIVLTLVSLCQDAASEFIYPLLPLLLTGVMHAPAVVVGVIESAAEGAAAVAKLVAGRLADRWGRKSVTGAGYWIATFGKVLVAASSVWPGVLVGRVVDRLGKGTRAAARDAWLASTVPTASLGKAFGFHRLGDTVGAVIGPLLGLAALSAMDNLRTALWLAVVPAVISSALVSFAPRPQQPSRQEPQQTPQPSETANDEDSASLGRDNRRSREPLGPNFWSAATTLAIISLINLPDALLLLRLSQTGWSAQHLILAYVLYNAAYAALSLPAGNLADKLGPRFVLALGLVAFAAALAGLGSRVCDHESLAAWALITVYGAFPALTVPVSRAWVSRTVPDAIRGRAQGTAQAMSNGAVLIAGLWAGLTWTAGRGHGAFPLHVAAGLGTLFASVLTIQGLRRRGLGFTAQAGVAE